tara:strand:+ start:77207 stop:77713 length:507 start_codon:yes stop_codon:yes gene_type:complete
MVEQKNNARSNNYQFVVGDNQEVSFNVQSTNVADIMLGTTTLSSRNKDVYVPSNKMDKETVNIQVLCSEDLGEWIWFYKWILKCKNSINFEEKTRASEIMALDSGNAVTARFRYLDSFPTSLTGLQYTTIGNSEYLVFDVVLRYNDFSITDKDGNEIDELWNGELDER